MFIFKKLFICTAASSVVAIPIGIHINQKYGNYYQRQADLISSLNQWNLPKLSEKELIHSDVYSLFANNLSTFTTNLVEAFSSLFIHKWSMSQLTNYVDKSLDIKKKLNHQSYPNSSSTLFNERSELAWKINDTAKETKKFFLKVIFDELLVEQSNGTVIPDTTKTKNNVAKKRIAAFQKAAIDLWIEEEKPFYLAKKTWGYSNAPSAIITSPSSETKSSYAYPDIVSNSDYGSFINSIKSSATLTAAEQIYTLGELKNHEDGFYVAGMFEKYDTLENTHRSRPSNNITPPTISTHDELDLSSDSATFKDKLATNPVYLFLDKTSNGSSEANCIKLNKEVLKDTGDQSKITTGNQACLHSIRHVKGGSSKAKATFIRDNTGITALYKGVGSTPFEKRILDTLRTDFAKRPEPQKRDEKGELLPIVEPEKSETTKKFWAYLEANLPRIIAKHTTSTGINNLISDVNLDMVKIKTLLELSADFQKILKNNLTYQQLKEKVYQPFEDYGQLETEKSGSDVWLKKDAGLISPPFLANSIENKTEIKLMDLTKSSESTEWIKNDGSFTKLKLPHTGYDALYKKAKELKTEIKTYLNRFESFKLTEKNQKIYEFNDFLADSLFASFLENQTLMQNYTNNAKIISQLELNPDNLNDQSTYLSKVTQLIKTRLGNDEFKKTDLEDTIADTFYLSRYFKLPFSEKLSYGGYKSTDKDWSQLRLKAKNVWTLKTMFSKGSAYEMSHQDTKELLTHLYSIKWLLDKNLEKIIPEIIPQQEYGALVWIKDIDSTKDYEDLKVDTANSIENLKDLETKYAATPSKSPIFHPIFNTTTFKALSDAHTLEPDTKNIEANAYKDNGASKSLSGFYGLQTSKFFNPEIREFVKSAIFKSFELSNPNNNKNYSETSQTTTENNKDDAKPIRGSAFGIVLAGENTTLTATQIADLFNQFKNKESLLTFLTTNVKSLYPKVIEELAKDHEAKTLSHASINQIKEAITKAITADQNILQSFNRFSGSLQNIEINQMKDGENKKYLLNQNASDDQKGKLAFIVQVNHDDFINNLSKLKDHIDTSTIVKSLYMISNQSVIKNKIYNDLFYKTVR